MRRNIVKEKLKNGEVVVGCFQSIGSLSMVEMNGYAGFDFVILDSEHGPNDVSNMEALVTAADSVGIVPIIRVTKNDYTLILRALDIGALGVQVPQINTVREMEELAQAAYYYPLGNRGLAGSTRATNYGFLNTKNYIEMANKEVMTIAHIENKTGVDNLDEMLKVAGIDVFFIGIVDLSQSLGYPSEINHPVVQETVNFVIKKITAAGKFAGILAGDPESAQKWIEKGVRYITTSTTGLYKNAASQFVNNLKELGK